MNTLILALVVAASPADARAGSRGAVPADVRAFCEYANANAASESLRLMLPDLIGAFGWTHGTEQIEGLGLADALLPIATIGLRYDVAQLSRGLAIRRLGQAECDRYLVDSALRTFANHQAPAVALRALKARLSELEAALPRAGELLEAARESARSGGATVAELSALELRVDGLRTLADRTRRDLAALPAEGPAPSHPLSELVARRLELEARVVELEGSVRKARAWQLSLRGGYLKVFSQSDTRIPLYGMLTIAFNPASLLQGAEDERAARARSEWLDSDLDGIEERVRQAQLDLSAAATADRRRLAELAVLIEDLEIRLSDAEAIKSERLQRYRDHLWIDLVQARAETAYLRAHLEDASALAGEALAEPSSGGE